MVIWLIGMSGAGKTAIGSEIYSKIKSKSPNTVFLDGDSFRSIMGDDIGHTLADRKKNADRMCRICKFLDSQDIHVVCAILSLFHESQTWNRENIDNYYEVYIEVSMDILIQRDPKGLYKKAMRGELKDFVGYDIKFPEPANPDLIINNEGDKGIEEVAEEIWNSIPASYLQSNNKI